MNADAAHSASAASCGGRSRATSLGGLAAARVAGKRARVICQLGMVALGLGAAAAAYLLHRHDVHAVRTGEGRALVYTRRAQDGTCVRVLSAGGVWQSATYVGERRFEPVFAYHRAFDVVFDLEAQMRVRAHHGVRTVLALGGGGYAWPKHVLATHDDVKMDVVEIDPAVTVLARRWFYLDELIARTGVVDGSCMASEAADELSERGSSLNRGDDGGECTGSAQDASGAKSLLLSRGCDGNKNADAPRLGLITADARQVIEHPPARYDVIVNDCFASGTPVRALATVEAARVIRDALTEGGIYLVNVVSDGDGGDLSFLRDEVATLAQVFAHVTIVDASDEVWGGEDNYLLIASDAPYLIEGAIPYDDDFLGTVLRDC